MCLMMGCYLRLIIGPVFYICEFIYLLKYICNLKTKQCFGGHLKANAEWSWIWVPGYMFPAGVKTGDALLFLSSLTVDKGLFCSLLQFTFCYSSFFVLFVGDFAIYNGPHM